MKMQRAVWEIKFRQKFGKGQDWNEYTDTLVGPSDLRLAVERFAQDAWAEELGGDPCTGMTILTVNRIATLTRSPV